MQMELQQQGCIIIHQIVCQVQHYWVFILLQLTRLLFGNNGCISR